MRCSLDAFIGGSFTTSSNSFDPPVLDASELTLPEMLEPGLPHRLHRQVASRLELERHPEARRTAADGRERGATRSSRPDDFDWARPISGGPLSHGFEYYFGDDVPNFPPYAWFENDRVITAPPSR